MTYLYLIEKIELQPKIKNHEILFIRLNTRLNLYY